MKNSDPALRTYIPHIFRVATLEDLYHLPAPRLAPTQVKVQIALPGVEGAQREQFERRLAHELAACGCPEGSITVMVYLVAVSLLALLGWLPLTSILAWVAIVVGLVAASLLGKVFGLTIAQVRLRRVIAELQTALGQERRG